MKQNMMKEKKGCEVKTGNVREQEGRSSRSKDFGVSRKHPSLRGKEEINKKLAPSEEDWEGGASRPAGED